MNFGKEAVLTAAGVLANLKTSDLGNKLLTQEF